MRCARRPTRNNKYVEPRRLAVGGVACKRVSIFLGGELCSSGRPSGVRARSRCRCRLIYPHTVDRAELLARSPSRCPVPFLIIAPVPSHRASTSEYAQLAFLTTATVTSMVHSGSSSPVECKQFCVK